MSSSATTEEAPSVSDVEELIRMIEKHLCEDQEVRQMISWVSETLLIAAREKRSVTINWSVS